MIEGLDLVPGVHAVIADGRAVFLDEVRDRYFKLDRSRTVELSNPASAQRPALLAGLARRGLIGAAAKPASDTEVQRFALAPAHGRTLFNVLGACRWADRALATRAFAEIVASMRAAPIAQALDRDLVDWFLRRRPFYARRYNCLFDTLAIVRFLRARAMAGAWVFGVRAAPFAAHCWLEHKGVCLNDDPDFVAPYARILVV